MLQRAKRGEEAPLAHSRMPGKAELSMNETSRTLFMKLVLLFSSPGNYSVLIKMMVDSNHDFIGDTGTRHRLPSSTLARSRKGFFPESASKKVSGPKNNSYRQSHHLARLSPRPHASTVAEIDSIGSHHGSIQEARVDPGRAAC